MKSAIFLATSGAILAAATPVVVTDVVEVWDTVTVTAQPAAPTKPAKNNDFNEAAIQAPAPTTTQEQNVVIVTETYVPPTKHVQHHQHHQQHAYPTAPAPEPEPTTTTTKESYPTSTKQEPSQPTSGPPSKDDMPGTAIYHHNYHRSNNSAPNLDWDDEIAGYAGVTADTCVFAHDTSTGGGGYGQNLAMWATTEDPASLGVGGAIGMATTSMWYTEMGSYPGYGSEPSMGGFEAWGHYSQLVWKDTKKVGCAVKLCPSGTMVGGMEAWFMVCNYSPPGNVQGAYAKNVLPPLGMAVMEA